MEILPSLSDIKKLRKKLNISQETLGEKLNLSQKRPTGVGGDHALYLLLPIVIAHQVIET